jgi:hypothetical protein
MANREQKDNKLYEEIKTEYYTNLLSLEEACKKHNTSMRTYYNTCKRIGKPSVAHNAKAKKIQTGGNANIQKIVPRENIKSVHNIKQVDVRDTDNIINNISKKHQIEIEGGHADDKSSKNSTRTRSKK